MFPGLGAPLPCSEVEAFGLEVQEVIPLLWV